MKLLACYSKYFVDLEYSIIGSILNVPNVKLNDEDSFEAFNFYRSAAWQIRGVTNPLDSMYLAGNDKLYAYRYDWDDHRRFVVAISKSYWSCTCYSTIIGRKPDLVGGHPLSDLIYPPSMSKDIHQKYDVILV